MQVTYIEFNKIKPIAFKHNLCLGFFDGIHLGHQSLINEAKKMHESISVLTFDTSFKGGKYLTSLEDKIDLFALYGVDYLFVLKMDDALKQVSPADFIEKVLKVLNPINVICGEDYTFGYKGEGNPSLLEKYFPVHCLKLLPYKNEDISTTLIKKMIGEGKIEQANELLGHPYKIIGPVVSGYHNGTKHLFPTINVSLTNYIVPKFGVYVVKLNLKNGDHKKAIANVGLHPTINKLHEPVLEIFFKEKLPLEEMDYLNIEFLQYVREERKFDSLEDLKKQIAHDIGLV